MEIQKEQAEREGDLVDLIRDHYDRLSGFYRAFWGDHIHHGYWEEGRLSTPKAAQERLVIRLAERAEIPRGARILDVGSGVGGSAMWLARALDCTVDGITLSTVQAAMATARARELGIDDRVRFWVHDAHDLDALGDGYDVVWTVECSEHLLDRPSFLSACSRRVQPGGTVALCSWLRGAADVQNGEDLHRLVCEAMLCPPLATLNEIVQFIGLAGLEAVEAEDIAPRVAQTWDRCASIAVRPEVRAILALSDERTRRFVEAFPAMQQAYARGVLGYGMFVARRPESRDR